MKRIFAVALLCSLLFAAIPADAEEDEWQLVTEEGTVLTSLSVQPEAGDRYMSGNNQEYEVIAVEQGKAIARHLGIRFAGYILAECRDCNARQHAGR